MSARTLPGLVAVLSFLAGTRLQAQVSGAATDACREALRAQKVPQEEFGELPCRSLAAIIVDRLTAGQYAPLVDRVVRPRDLQSTVTSGPATGGSAAQGEAVPAPHPVALAGGSIAALGTDAGSDAVAALSLNPALFFLDPARRLDAARLSRLMDLSVFVPVEGLDKNQDGSVDYFGVRMRINVTGLSQGSAVMREARRIFGSMVAADAQLMRRLENAIEGAADPGACIAALGGGQGEAQSIRAGCGTDIPFDVPAEQYEDLAGALRQAREIADSRSFGLDLRLDVGDPTLGAVAGARGTFLYGGVAAARRFVGSGDQPSSAGFRVRLGVRFASLADTAVTSFAVDGGIGFEARRVYEQQAVNLSTGLELRWGGSSSSRDRLQTNILMFRASLSVPITAANSVSLNLGVPLLGEVTPVLSVAVNWGLLLPTR